MMIRKFSLGLATLALLVATPLQAQQTLNFRDADVRAFLQDAARVTGRTFIVDSRVQAKISVVTDRAVSRSEFFEIVLSTLRANGLVAVRTSSGAYRVQLADTAAASASRVGSRPVSRNQFVTEVFRLRNIDALSAVETLRPLVSREGSITANKGANSVVVADYADNMVRIRDLIRRIDREPAKSAQIVTLKNAGAQEIAQALKGMDDSVAVSPIDSSNAVALRGDPAAVARLVAMASQLDQRAASGTEIRVYWLQHADAARLLPTLQMLVGQSVSDTGGASLQAAAPPALNGNGDGGATGDSNAGRPQAVTNLGGATGGGITKRGSVVVTRYEGANAIIVAGNPDVQRMLGETIRQLDSRRPQVQVEALVAEISDDAAKKLGVQFLLAGKNMPFAATNYSNAQPNILTIGGAYGATKLDQTTTTINGQTVVVSNNSPLSDTLQQAAAESILGATGGLGGVLFDIGRNGLFGAIINAVKSDTESNVLSTPSVMVLDNHKAEMLVGQEVPITTGEALSNNFDNAFRTVQRQKVGIQLEVTPQINASGEVKLYVRQEVSSVAGPVSSRSTDLIINKREFNTTLTVDDGQIMAMGGLLDQNERRTLQKIPLLGDLPVVGNLFRSKSRSRAKTNLVVFIRPTIVRDRQDGDEVTTRRYNYFRNRQIEYYPDREPSIDELLRDYMGIMPPIPDEVRAGDVRIAPPPLTAPPPAPVPPAGYEGAPPPPPGSEAILPQVIDAQRAGNPR